MKVNIVSDSSLDLTEEMVEEDVSIVPFKISLDGKDYIDNDQINMQRYVEHMKSAEHFDTTCPSPADYVDAFQKEGDTYAITITSKLSGSYNSAILAKNMVMDELQKKIHVFNSMGASTTLLLVYKKLLECIKLNFSFEETVIRVEEYIHSLQTLFILDSLENLRKKGRLSNMQVMIAKTLNLYPIMGAEEGQIIKLSQARGKKRALKKLVQHMSDFGEEFKDKVVAVSHAGNLEEAEQLKKMIQKKLKPKQIYLITMSALNYMYADDRGIIVSFES